MKYVAWLEGPVAAVIRSASSLVSRMLPLSDPLAGVNVAAVLAEA